MNFHMWRRKSFGQQYHGLRKYSVMLSLIGLKCSIYIMNEVSCIRIVRCPQLVLLYWTRQWTLYAKIHGMFGLITQVLASLKWKQTLFFGFQCTEVFCKVHIYLFCNSHNLLPMQHKVMIHKIFCYSISIKFTYYLFLVF